MPDHIVFVAFCRADHMRWLDFSSPLSVQFFSDDNTIFKCIFAPQNDDHIFVFELRVLTTFLTIVTSGVHGDKMSGEYENAVFA